MTRASTVPPIPVHDVLRLHTLVSRPHGTLYVGVTNDLVRRVCEHREGIADGFTGRHDVKCLVYFEMHEDIEEAIKREKTLKRWRRA